ncbi:hypothetical protein CYY_004019 [Polysphondylium violaceum]|uniref:Chorein N-terminal domain-containing protein n=1 Tax=Polysphondylium violaceum TaxID=133409 RepID=A0A8J4V856_9MYCE|nr:hypothetical protein CYY_004019 [Polysphondylium violaceum]
MEALVLKVLKKYLKLFIKNFTSDNFSMSVLKGEGTLVDLDLNETIIQELLLIPPQFKVTHASCDLLTAKVPWTSFKKEPIVISLNSINIDLKEPDEIIPVVSQLKKFKKKNKNKRNEITENLQIEVKSLKLNVASLYGNTLMIEIEDVLIQSTNSNFQPGDLLQIKSIDKEQGIESLHKLITARSISIRIQDMGGMTTPILENMPIKILYCTKRRIKDWIQLSAKIEFVLKQINLRWTLSQWHSLNDLIHGFQATLARAVPQATTPGVGAPTPKEHKNKLFSSKKKDSISSGTSTPVNIISSTNSLGNSSTTGNSPLSTSPSISKLKESGLGGDSSTTSSLATSPMTSSTGEFGVQPTPKHSDFSYDFHIERWKLELVDNYSQDSDSGYHFKGEGLHFGFTSANTVAKPINPDTNSPFYVMPIRETILSVVMNTLSVNQVLSFSKNISKATLADTNLESRGTKVYNKTITSISSESIPERISIHNYTGPFLLKGNLLFRKPITNQDNPDPLANIVHGPPLIGLELNLHLNDFKLHGDRRSWKTLISFLAPPESDESDIGSESESHSTTTSTTKSIIDNLESVSLDDKNDQQNGKQENSNNGTQQHQHHHHKGVIEKGKKKISTFKRKLKLGDHWKNQIKIILKATNTQLTIPEEKIPEFQGLKLIINLGSFVMCNHSDWKVVPYLADGLQFIDNKVPQADSITVSGRDHRFSFQMENIALSIIDTKDSSVHPVLEPSTISLFLRISRTNTLLMEKRIPKIDVSFISSDFNFKITTQQSLFLDHVANKYLSPKKMKNLLGARISKEAKKRLKSLDDKHLDKTITIKNKVEKTLQRYYWNSFISIQKGDFFLPLSHFLEPKEKSSKKGDNDDNNDTTATTTPQGATTIDTPLEMISNVVQDLNLIPQSIITSVDNDEANQSSAENQPLSQLKVENLGIILQNNQQGQTIIFKIGSFEAYGIDHPKLSTSTILRPLPIPDDEYIPAPNTDSTNLFVTYKRRQKALAASTRSNILIDEEMEEWTTDVWVKLQGTQVRVMKKHLSPAQKMATKSLSKKIKMPDVKNFITKVVSLVERKRDKISQVKKGIKKVNLDIKWGIELGNCEILLGEKSKNSIYSCSDFEIAPDYQPKGIIKITDTNRKINAKAYRDIEEELLKKNSEFATAEEEKDEYNNRIGALVAEIDKLKKTHHTELSALRSQYEELEVKFVATKLKLAEIS